MDSYFYYDNFSRNHMSRPIFMTQCNPLEFPNITVVRILTSKLYLKFLINWNQIVLVINTICNVQHSLKNLKVLQNRIVFKYLKKKINKF